MAINRTEINLTSEKLALKSPVNGLAVRYSKMQNIGCQMLFNT